MPSFAPTGLVCTCAALCRVWLRLSGRAVAGLAIAPATRAEHTRSVARRYPGLIGNQVPIVISNATSPDSIRRGRRSVDAQAAWRFRDAHKVILCKMPRAPRVNTYGNISIRIRFLIILMNDNDIQYSSEDDFMRIALVATQQVKFE